MNANPMVLPKAGDLWLVKIGRRDRCGSVQSVWRVKVLNVTQRTVLFEEIREGFFRQSYPPDVSRYLIDDVAFLEQVS